MVKIHHEEILRALEIRNDVAVEIAIKKHLELTLHGFPCRGMAEVMSFVGNGVARLMELL